MFIAVSNLFGCGGGSSSDTGTSTNISTATAPTAGTTAAATPTAGSTITTTPTSTPSATTMSTSTQAAAVAGLYQGSAFNGSTSKSLAFNALILPDGRYVGLYSWPTGGPAGLGGFFTGVGTAMAGSFAGSGMDYNLNSTVSQGTLSLSYQTNTSLSGTYNEPAGTKSFTASVLPVAQYAFNRAPAISEFVGTWAMSTMSGTDLTITFAPDNTLSGINAGTCNFSGTLTPNVAGKNVFDVLYKFDAGCSSGGRTAYGIAFSALTASGQRQTTLTVIDSSGKFADVFASIR